MSDNYPPGAARDPRAPYNEPVPKEWEVEAVETVTKADYVLLTCDPGGHRLWDEWQEQHLSVEQCLRQASTVINQLYNNQKPNRFFAKVDLAVLLDEMAGWETDNIEVSKI